ncbi:MAG: hypothetical protein H0W44_02445 [Gammaproteobacteria bacterium]|nr:hypothetical protein [Gammaproteobacteria bacterium]
MPAPTSAAIDAASLPPKPQEPHPDECCQGGCNPCIFDYYTEALGLWQAECARLLAQDKT